MALLQKGLSHSVLPNEISDIYVHTFSIFNHTDSKIVVVTGEARLQGQQKKNVDDQKSVRKKEKKATCSTYF